MGVNRSVLRAEADDQEWHDVDSSNVDSVAYSEDFARLYVKFHNGTMYVYHTVTPDVFRRFLAAPSKGKFVWSEIRNKGQDNVYPYDEL